MKTAAATESKLPGSGLRILVVNSVLTGGGVDTQTLSQCQALIGQGAQVLLAISAKARWIDRARAIAGLDVMVLPMQRWWWPMRLAMEVRRRGIQVLHAHHGRDYWVAILARLWSARPAVVVVTRHLMSRLKPKTRWYLAAFTHVVAVSDAVLSALRTGDARSTLRLRRIYCGIDTATFRPDPALRASARQAFGWPQEAVVFAVVGAVHAPEGKGQFHFIQAAQQILAACPTAHFVCAGSGEAAPALRDQAARLGLGERFRWLPFSDDMPQLMQAIDVLVHPAVSSEALGLVLLEALSSGKPVIGSRLDGIPETFADGLNGLSVAPRDVSGLADAMSTLARDPLCRQRMGEHGRAWVEARFSLEHVGRETIALYREALTQGS
jgi:glycosyltransferase involved in cell wall biosynthesis